MMEHVCWLLGSPLFVALCVSGLREAFGLRCLAVDRGWVVGGEMAASVVEGCLRLRLYLRQCRTEQVVWGMGLRRTEKMYLGLGWGGWMGGCGWVSTSMQAVSFVLGCLSCLWVICMRGCLCCDMSWQCFTSSSYVHIHTFYAFRHSNTPPFSPLRPPSSFPSAPSFPASSLSVLLYYTKTNSFAMRADTSGVHTELEGVRLAAEGFLHATLTALSHASATAKQRTSGGDVATIHFPGHTTPESLVWNVHVPSGFAEAFSVSDSTFDADATLAISMNLLSLVANVLDEIGEGWNGWQWGNNVPMVVKVKEEGSRYCRAAKEVCFGQSHDGEWMCRRSGVVCHEIGHAILDGMLPGIYDVKGEAEAIHEAFADFMHIFWVCSDSTLCDYIAAECKGTLRCSPLLCCQENGPSRCADNTLSSDEVFDPILNVDIISGILLGFLFDLVDHCYASDTSSNRGVALHNAVRVITLLFIAALLESGEQKDDQRPEDVTLHEITTLMTHSAEGSLQETCKQIMETRGIHEGGFIAQRPAPPSARMTP